MAWWSVKSRGTNLTLLTLFHNMKTGSLTNRYRPYKCHAFMAWCLSVGATLHPLYFVSIPNHRFLQDGVRKSARWWRDNALSIWLVGSCFERRLYWRRISWFSSLSSRKFRELNLGIGHDRLLLYSYLFTTHDHLDVWYLSSWSALSSFQQMEALA